jgi:hypothetical protein
MMRVGGPGMQEKPGGMRDKPGAMPARPAQTRSMP